MARNISADSDGYVYRALVRIERPNGRVEERSYGPYTKAGTAKAQLTLTQNSYWNRGSKVTGTVQSAYLKDWVDIDG